MLTSSLIWSAALCLAVYTEARPATSSSIVRAPHRSRRSSTAAASLQTPISAINQSSTATSPSAMKALKAAMISAESKASKSSQVSKSKNKSSTTSKTAKLSKQSNNPTIAHGDKPPKVTAPYKNIFNSLTDSEAASVIKFLHAQESLNLTAEQEAGPWDNSIMVIDLNPPNKTDALSYFAGDIKIPERWAKASISFGATEEPYVQEFVVGPLPLDEGGMYFPDTFGTHAEEAKIRIYDMDDSTGFAYDQVMEMDDIVRDLLETNFTTLKQFKKEFVVWGIDPLWREPDEDGNERIIFWVQIWRSGKSTGGDTLLPQGIYLRADITGRNSSNWSLTHILYGNELYPSIDAFRTAWREPGFKKMNVNHGGDWIDVESTGQDKGEGLLLDDRAPPRQISVDGQRFRVDEEERYVEWMDFSFFITFTRDTGMRLHDIKFKGERIIYSYEGPALGLEEAIAHYAGNDPVQSGTAYLDTYYGFGPYCFNQIPGYDFPLQGYCMSTTWHADELSKKRKCGITIFEEEQPYLLQRHTSAKYVQATKNIALTVRSISTVGNYDYTFDYVFYLDGSIETVVRASGYIQSAFYANNSDYGYQIHDALSGSMHDHSLQFKADLDIAGTENTMVKHTFIPVDVDYKWSNITRSTMKLSRSEVTNEDESRMNWAHNSKELVLIVNKDALNKYGEERGYKIMPSRGPPGIHQTITNSTNLQKSGATGSHGYFVTKHKDEEKRSTSPWNAYDPGHPLVDFDKFFDGESLVQEDLVLWFNLGMHHVPHTGDLPNTVFTTAQSGMWITPHNYLLSDPSRQSKQMIHIDLDEDGVASNVTTYGQKLFNVTVDQTPIEWDAMTYVGDVVTRKFPYDPQHPFNQTVVLT